MEYQMNRLKGLLWKAKEESDPDSTEEAHSTAVQTPWI